MLPKTHAIAGGIFSILIYFIFQISLFNAFLIFLASFLIDFDHSVWYICRKKDFSLKKAYNLLKSIEKPPKPIMVIFHTIEFLLFMFILSFFFEPFLFLLIGMLFHSVLDIIDLEYRGIFNYREFSLIRYLFSNKKNYY